MEQITDQIKQKIISLWDNYVADNRRILDTKGKLIVDIDTKRKSAIIILNQVIQDFLNNKMGVGEFKTAIDSFNKQNNLWGFTSIKGQMFFNILLKTCESDSHINSLTALLRRTIVAPSEINDSLQKINALDEYCTKYFSKAKDKRKSPNPNSVGYFLSYFWQIQNNEKWPIMYSSILSAWEEIGSWKDQPDQAGSYHFFYLLNNKIRQILSDHANQPISNWDAEHVFWNFKPITAYPKKEKEKEKKSSLNLGQGVETNKHVYQSSFNINDYLIPRVTKLMEFGSQTSAGSAKGYEYEKLTEEIFKLLDFEVESLGQGKGRHPDIIVKFREENTVFIVDAKAYGGGYSLGTDDRAIKEYIHHHCPRLQKDGYKKIGFIIVSNSFKSNFDAFINEITWNTDIKRFILLTSDALLHLLAYKTKLKLPISTIIESMVSFGNVITAQDIIEEFDDF